MKARPKSPSPKQREALELVASGRFYPALVKEDDGWHARWFPYVCGEAPDGTLLGWVDEIIRSAAVTPLSEDAEDQSHETLHDAWINALKSRTGLVRWDDAECAAFAEELRRWADAGDGRERKDVAFRLRTDGEGFFIECDMPRGRTAFKALGETVYLWGKLRELRRHGRRLRVRLEISEAEDFVRRGAAELRGAGYTVEGDDLLAGITVSAAMQTDDAKLETTAKLDLVIKVDGHPVSMEEIRFLLEQKSNFVYFHEHWIEIDRGILKEALRALERCRKEKVDAMPFALGIGSIGRFEIEDAVVKGGVSKLLADFRKIGRQNTEASAIPGLQGVLRDYQRRGVAWMSAVTDRGFGALLADDMGLGKTVQTIGWILARGGKGFLIVAPLTLLSNWAHELAAFAPGLRVYVHQGENRHLASGFRRACAEADVVITSYNLLVRDHFFFTEVHWAGMVLDEAQTIKNFDTRTARAVRSLSPRWRIALSGTPIENSVEDIWSIEEFLNPGLLGERKFFEERFVKPLASDPSHGAGRRLKKALEPFVLRRLKTDPGIAAELGEKREKREYCELAPSQRAEYERLLADYRQSRRRQGDVFALITALKLACDGQGKLVRLFDLLEQIFANGESALVFTQYAKVGTWIKRELDRRFAKEFPFLHGALSVSAREREIAAFNRPGPSAFVLSLRAGGFGLNLVKATHVIHFDRWWNPAVESQATDRAHRIGQEHTVFVHDFVTAGTLEERIEDILSRKQSLEGLLTDGERLWKVVSLE